MKKIKNRVKELRVKEGWNQSDLAEKTNISRQTISLIERNKFNPSILLALKLSRVFSQKVENIFIIDDDDFNRSK